MKEYWVILDRSNRATVVDSPMGRVMLVFTSQEKADAYVHFWASHQWGRSGPPESVSAQPNAQADQEFVETLESSGAEFYVVDHRPLTLASMTQCFCVRKYLDSRNAGDAPEAAENLAQLK